MSDVILLLKLFGDTTPQHDKQFPSLPFSVLARATTFHFCKSQSIEEVSFAYDRIREKLSRHISLSLDGFRLLAINTMDMSMSKARGHPFFLATIRLYFQNAIAHWGSA